MRRRGFGSIAVRMAAAGLGLSLLSGCRAAPLYTSSGPIVVPTGNICAKPTVIPMNPKNAQSGVTEGNYYITNDTWNASHYTGLSQALYVCRYNNWYTIATMDNDTLDGAVKTSPNVQETWYPTPTRLSTWKSITSHYSDVPPGAGPSYGTWEFEYDSWLNGLADSSSTEVMIWTFDNGRSPNGALSRVIYRRGPHLQRVPYAATIPVHRLCGPGRHIVRKRQLAGFLQVRNYERLDAEIVDAVSDL